MKELSLSFIFTLFILACVNTPKSAQIEQIDIQNNESKAFLTKIEYYFNFIGRPVPSHFRPISIGSNVYEPPENYPTVGREILSVGVKNGIVEKVFVFCIFENRSDYGDWFWSYVTEAERLGFRHGIDNETDIIFFAKENFAFVFIDKENENLSSGQFEFWKL